MPRCPEHGCEMWHELRPDWWRGKCGCPIRVFNEDRRSYVPASSVNHQTLPGLFGKRIWWPRRGHRTVWYLLGATW